MFSRRVLISLSGLLVFTLFASCSLSGVKGVSVRSIFGKIAPQEYTWHPERSPKGPLLVFVSIPRQEAVVYRNGIRIGRASVSTGRPGHETPTGVFQILQKDADHHSSTYGNAPMPYMERLTWEGVALHTGFNPGHPASHGCVRMPDGFAKELFKITHVGGTVIISNSRSLPTMGLAEGFGTSGSGGANWSGLSKTAATSVVISTSERLAVVYQNGRRVGSSQVDVRSGLSHFEGEEVFLYAGDNRWHTVEGKDSFDKINSYLRLSASFQSKLHQVIHPGTTLIVTSEPIGSRGGRSQSVIGATGGGQ